MKLLLQAFVVVLAYRYQADAAYCHSPFIELASACYYLHPEPMTWSDARNFCFSMSGSTDITTDLARVRNCDQYATLWQYLLMNSGANSYWLGGNDVGQEGNWHWVTGETMPLGHPYWQYGEPYSHPEHNCMGYDGPSGYFNSKDCQELHTFICQDY